MKESSKQKRIWKVFFMFASIFLSSMVLGGG